MKDITIPEGYQSLMPYYILRNAKGFLEWIKAVFGAQEKYMSYQEDGATVAHAEMWVSGATVMVGEVSDKWPENTCAMFLYVPDADAAYQRGLAQGGKSLMEPADMPYGRACGVLDPFGNTWWINTPPKS